VKHVKTGAMIAIAAGSLFASACKKDEPAASQKPAVEDKKPEQGAAVQPAPSAEKTSKVDCGGVNACKGQGTCKTEKHGCGGQNECKGQGVVTMSEDDCKAKGGTITARK